jgi:hypothetical protein
MKSIYARLVSLVVFLGQLNCLSTLEKTMKNQNRLTIRCLLACMVAAVLGYKSPAIAAPPDKLPPASFSDEIAAGLACNFDLLIEGFGGNRHLKAFTDANGNVVRTLTAGTGSALRFTNLTTGETFSTKSNGAVVHTRFNSDGSVTVTDTGHNVLILFPTDVPAGPSTTLIVGRVVFTIDNNGVFTVLDVSGRTVDICAALS